MPINAITQRSKESFEMRKGGKERNIWSGRTGMEEERGEIFAGGKLEVMSTNQLQLGDTEQSTYSKVRQ